MTYEELPKDSVRLVILVRHGFSDATLEYRSRVGLGDIVHNNNYGYGANQKTCYAEALRAGADIVVMVYPDHPVRSPAPAIIAPILGTPRAGFRAGSRLQGGRSGDHAVDPMVEVTANRVLTGSRLHFRPTAVLSTTLAIALYQPQASESVNFRMNSDGFVLTRRYRAGRGWAFAIAEIPVPVRYFPEASSASFVALLLYGVGILWVLIRYLLHRSGIKRFRRLANLQERYSRMPGAAVRRGERPGVYGDPETRVCAISSVEPGRSRSPADDATSFCQTPRSRLFRSAMPRPWERSAPRSGSGAGLLQNDFVRPSFPALF